MKKSSITTTTPATAPAGKETPSPESLVTLVQHRSPKRFCASGGNLEAALRKRGHDLNLRELSNIPQTCPKGQEINMHYLIHDKDDGLPLEQVIAAARKQGFEPACSCEFSEAILADGFNPDVKTSNIPPNGALFFTVARRIGKNGGNVVMLAAAGAVYTIRAESFPTVKSKPKMVLLCVPAAEAKKRNKKESAA